MKTEKTAFENIAYSYIRFSTPKQAEGDSLRRQTELAENYCRRQGLTLSTATYRDLGVSAFKGKNALVGNLGEFLKAVESGAVKHGSVLIVESLDRISRQGIDGGYDVVKRILKAGIRLVTLSPEREFDQSATKSLSKGALEIQLILERAAEESERKSERLGHAWKEKQRLAAENKEPATARTPSWLRLVGVKFSVVERAADAVRQIFEMATEGYGLGLITKRLNAMRVPPISRGKGRGEHWARSYVDKILHNRSVLGEYQPHTIRGGKREPIGNPILGYYPPIITERQWYAAQAALQVRKNKPGRVDHPSGRINVFSGLLRDALDSGSMQIVDKGKKGGKRSLVSYNAVHGLEGSRYASFPFDTFERAVLTFLYEINPDELQSNRQADDSVAELTGRKEEIEAEIEKIKNRLQTRYSDAVAEVLERHEETLKAINREREAALHKAAHPLSRAWSDTKSLIAVLDSAPDQREMRLRLRAAIRRIVRSIAVLIPPAKRDRLAWVHIYFADGRLVRGYFICHRPSRGGVLTREPAKWRAESWAGDLLSNMPEVLPEVVLEDADYHYETPDLPKGDYPSVEEQLLRWYDSIRNDPEGWNPLL